MCIAVSEHLRFHKDIVFIFGLWEWGARSGGSLQSGQARWTGEGAWLVRVIQGLKSIFEARGQNRPRV